MDADAIARLGRGILDALRARELERAEALVNEAQARQDQHSFQDRAAVITELSRCISAAKMAKERALNEAAALPGVSRLDVELRLLGPLDRLLERELDKLRREKQRLSRPH
jgi:hypothetical protein